jgi:hypothetical protein
LLAIVLALLELVVNLLHVYLPASFSLSVYRVDLIGPLIHT